MTHSQKTLGSLAEKAIDACNKSSAEGDVARDDNYEISGPDVKNNWRDELELSLLVAVKHLLKISGASYSEAAIRDLPDVKSECFDPKAAIGALQNAGYTAQFGHLPNVALEPSLLPAIGFSKEGDQAYIISEMDEFRTTKLLRWGGQEAEEVSVEFEQLEHMLAPYYILAKKLDPDAKSPRPNDWFWGSFAKSKWQFSQVLLAAALTNVLGLSTSLFVMIVYDRVVPNQAIESLFALTAGILVALSFEFLIKTLRTQFINNVGRKADARMTRLIFEKLISMPADKKRQNSGAMASIVREFETLREFMSSATIVAIVDLPFIFIFIYIISIISGPLAVIPLLAVPVVIFTGLVIQPLMARISDSASKTGMSKQSVLIETLSGLETIQATGSGHLMRQRFEQASDTQSKLNVKSRALTQFAINSSASIQQLAQIATVFYGVFLIQDGTVTMGALIAAMILGGRTLGPLAQIASAMSRANSAKSAFKSLSQIMRENEKSAEALSRPRLSRPHLNGEIEFRQVCYTFPGANAPIIDNLSFKIPVGQKVAVLGRMGSGKSTIARLCAGLIEPTSGSVLLDGVDVRQLDQSDLRRNVGTMLQETWLFTGSVKENLQMGFYEYDDAHILEIAKISGVDEFISKHPAGYDMELRERGEGLSGGQRQSINLARALLHDPSVLVLDEPTSSMDSSSEKSVIERLKTFSANKTVLMITHRNSLLELADRVLVIDNGKIMADTTPAQIRKQSA